MFNLYVAEKQKKQREEKLKEEKLTIKLKNNRKSIHKLFIILQLNI